MMSERTINICGVCGDKAMGRNFGAMTCESCKTFFRRIYTRYRIIPMQCRFGTKCVVTKENRRYCQKCRLDKCLEIGMRQEFVGMRVTAKDAINRVTDEDLNEGIHQMERLLTETHDNSDNEWTQTETTSSIVKPIATYDKQFKDIELNRLQELCIASCHFKNSIKARETKYMLEINEIDQMYKQMSKVDFFDVTLRSAIGFCQSLHSYKEMCDDDKITLFKNTCFKLVALKFLCKFNYDKSCMVHNVTDSCSIHCNLGMFKVVGPQQFDMIKNFWRVVSSVVIRDDILINLLMGVVLYRSELPGLSHRGAIKLNQRMYFYLLQRYLLLKFRSEVVSSQRLSDLMKILSDLQTFYEIEMQLARDHAHLFTPLVREIFEF